MANFNDQVNNYIGRYFAHRPLEIRRVDTMKDFERAISGWMNDYFNPASSEYKSKEKLASMDSVFQDGQFDEMDECDIHCSLYILYKEEHRVQKLAGRCFSWDNMEEAFIGIKGEELKLEKGRYLGNRNGFCIPRFDAMQAAVLITDYEVVAYGDSYIEADDMDEDLVHCNVYVGYGLVADIHINTKEFDRFFGLKENFPKQYDEIFGQAKVPYAEPFDAQVEADEQADTEAAQIVAETDPESTDDDETTKHTANVEVAQIVAETAQESTNDEETTKHTANVENAPEWTIDETDMTDIQWLCKWLSEIRPEYKAICKWMYEREEERKTDDRLDAKETRDSVMIVGGSVGGGRRREWQKRMRNEIETHRIAI